MKKTWTVLLILSLLLSTLSACAISDENQKRYKQFFSSAEESAAIPALDEGFVPQGLCILDEKNIAVISAYRAEGASALFFVNLETGECEKRIYLLQPDGSAYTGHAGGVADGYHSLFVTSGSTVWRMDMDKALSAADGDSVAFDDTFANCTRASLACVSQGVLWVGDFYTSSGGYATDASHHMKTPAKDRHSAWAVGYVLDETTTNELRADCYDENAYPVPDYILSLPDQVQGMTRLADGQFVLSTSYGRNATSYLKVYRNVLLDEPHATAQIMGHDVPLWFLDSAALTGNCFAPCMSEALEFDNGKLYVLFESGAQSYANGACPLDHLYTVSDMPY